ERPAVVLHKPGWSKGVDEIHRGGDRHADEKRASHIAVADRRHKGEKEDAGVKSPHVIRVDVIEEVDEPVAAIEHPLLEVKLKHQAELVLEVEDGFGMCEGDGGIRRDEFPAGDLVDLEHHQIQDELDDQPGKATQRAFAPGQGRWLVPGRREKCLVRGHSGAYILPYRIRFRGGPEASIEGDCTRSFFGIESWCSGRQGCDWYCSCLP